MHKKTPLPLISIVMAAYNAEYFITEAINSVINQTYESWELIIVDDCSKDKTKQIVKNILDPRIKLIELLTNVGAGNARNAGLDIATGEYIAFLDADDIWMPEKLEKQQAFMFVQQFPICHTSYSFIDERGESITGYVKASSKVDLNHYMKNTEIGLSTSMINKLIIKDFNFNPMRLRQDTRLWIDLLNRGYTAYGLDEELVKYRIRRNQISGNKLKSAWRTLKLYLSITEIPIHMRMVNFCFYALNGIIKRLRS